MKLHNKLPTEEFLKGLEILMCSLYFQFDSKNYQQKYGLPIFTNYSGFSITEFRRRFFKEIQQIY